MKAARAEVGSEALQDSGERDDRTLRVLTRLDALRAAIRDFEANHAAAGPGSFVWGQLSEALGAYLATGDHDHGWGTIPNNRPCPGGDCLTFHARALLRSQLP